MSDKQFSYSQYQTAIFDWIQHGCGNAVVKAAAGCGKTTTIVHAMTLVPSDKRCLFLAFNKSIVEELQDRVKDYDNCRVCTIHSLGFSLMRGVLGEDIAIDEYKYAKYVRENILNISQTIDNDTSPSVVEQFVQTVLELVDFSRANLCQSAKEITRAAAKYGITPIGDECDCVAQILDWGKDNTETMDYGDMVWLPYELSVDPKGQRYDWVLIDECQDFSKAYIDLFKRCFKRGTRFIAVGDKWQCINIFAGADEKSFDSLCRMPNTTTFELPISYRCDKNIVSLARKYNPSIQWSDSALEGIIDKDGHIDDIQGYDMVLCRSNAPLMTVYTRLLERNVPCYIKGGGNGEYLMRMLSSVDRQLLSKSFVADGFFPQLYISILDLRDNIAQRNHITKDEATSSASVLYMYDAIKSLEDISRGFVYKEDLEERVSKIFAETNEGVCLSTIHKSKGLEADSVYIIGGLNLPSKNAKKDWEVFQERNLTYVAYTRAKHKLAFLSEDEVPLTGAANRQQSIVSDFRTMEERASFILGREILREEDYLVRNITAEEEPSSPTAKKSLDDIIGELS